MSTYQVQLSKYIQIRNIMIRHNLDTISFLGSSAYTALDKWKIREVFYTINLIFNTVMYIKSTFWRTGTPFLNCMYGNRTNIQQKHILQ